MANLSEDALFSLELVVDKLTIPKIPCKFPAIAFRLLDFPTLVIYHVEPELGATIKGQIQRDPHYKLGPQIPDLLDKNGSFSLRKGKSCLLKISPDMLLSQLQSTPLYVMVIDTFPEVPKLIGNCTVPLDHTMDVLYDDICKQGLAVPVVHGEKGIYKIYNLMGTQIGGLELGIRLLSLGVGLIPHLPSASVSSGGKTVSIPNKKVNDEIQEKVADIVLGEFEQPAKASKGQVITVSKETKSKVSAVPQLQKKIDIGQFQVQTQTEEEIVQNMATQTDKRKSRARVKQKMQDFNIDLGQDLNDDIVITNVICPPPLYFNSENDSKYSGGLEIFNNLMENQKPNEDSESVFSDSDTIRKEDWASDSDVDVESTPFEETHMKKSQKTDSKWHMQQTKSKLNNNALNVKGFPLLNALMTEIVALQNGQTSQVQQSQSDIQIYLPSKHVKKREKSPSPSAHLPSFSRSPSPVRERESVEKHLNRMSTPRHKVRELPSPKTPRKVITDPDKPVRQHKCQHPPKAVPKGKSWIRQVPPPFGVLKTKLKPGMTNTQRLRLEKTNPELLKKLQKEEEERFRLWKEQERQRKAEEETTLGSTGLAQYTIDGHRIEGTYKPRDSHPHRKPVPTPRQNSFQGVEHHSLYDDRPSKQQYKSGTDKHSCEDEEYYSDHESITRESYNGDTDKNGHYEYEESDEVTEDISSQFNKKGKIGSTQRFVAGVPVGDLAIASEENNEYSYDFESARPTTQRTDTEIEVITDFGDTNGHARDINVQAMDAGEGLGLRKIVDEYSDHESEPSQTSFKSAASNFSNPSYPNNHAKNFNQSKPKTVSYSNEIEGPKVSVNDPAVTHTRNVNRNHVGGSLGNIEASVDSTAYISRSQVLSQQSYESVHSHSSGKEDRKQKPTGAVVKTHPNPRLRRNTESVSSYNGEDNENVSPRSGLSQTQGYQSESFEDYSDFEMPEPKSVNEAKVAPGAKLGYTWGF